MAKLSSSNGLEKRPKLRFPGFDEPWKETTLSALFSKSTQKNADGHITNVICNSAKLGLIPQREYFDKDIANSDNTSGYYIIRQNDFVYNPRKSSDAPYGPISSYKYAEDGIVSPLYLCFHAKDEINPLYYEWYFRSSAWHRYIYMSGDSGARHDRVSIKDDTFFAMPINLPSEQEQSKIASFLQSLDERIAAQEKLVASLKKYKRGSLSALFPKKREITPQYRFAGFTKPWEQRKAKELFVSTADKGYPELPVLSATQDRGMIRRDENSINIFHDKKNEAGYKRVLPGQFVIHLRSFQGGFAYSAIEGITSPAYTVFGFSEPEKHDSEYWKYVFTSKSFIRRLETVTYGIRDGRSISYEEFLTLGFVYPSKAEQTAIARCLDKLSDLITLHQHKYDTLLSLKNAILQQMFI